MLPQSQAKIYLAGERGFNETEGFRSYNTFNFGSYQLNQKQPFGPIYLWNDDTLAGNQSITMQVEEESDFILLPVVGAIIFKDNNGNETLIEAGQVQLYTANKNTSFEISNPYERELVNFLQIGIRHPPAINSRKAGIFSFDLKDNKNKLAELYPGTSNALHKSYIGKFSGRKECSFNTKGKAIFVFVIEGAFEVQYRLMESRDGLAIWDAEEIELEALSNEAIILITELNNGLTTDLQD